MSILIKDMEMPEHCGYCRFRYDGICHALQKTQYSMEECPLVPIPPHGDLIERDKLREKEYFNYADADAVVMSRDIRNAPTIIPADKDGGA